MSYKKQNFKDGQTLTAAMLNHIEDGIANVELTPGPQGEPGPQGPQGEPGEAPDLSSYLIETEADNKYQPKGEYLTEHQKLKTINGQSLVGEGDIEISGAGLEDGLDVRDVKRHLDSRMIMPVRPKSQGVANAIKRAYQFTDVLWTPQGEYPGVDYGPVEGRVKYMFQPGVTYRGVPYEGGVISTNNYTGLCVDLDTFLSALDSPNSALYNYDNNNDKGGGYYGTVCSKLVQYALAIPATHNTANIPNLEKVITVAAAGEYTMEDVQLGDILCYPSSHTAMVTGIYRNAYHGRNSGGEILYIEVSDAVYPVCRRRLYNLESFTETWITNYGLYRYTLIDDVPYVENDFVKIDGDREAIKYADYALMPYEGNKRNYIQDSSGTVKVHILKTGYTKAVVKRDGEIVDTINITSSTKEFTFSKATTGHVEMYLEDANGNKSESVYAYVVKATVNVTKSVNYNKGEIEISFTGTSGVPYYVMFSQTQCCRLDGKGESYISGDGTAVIKFKTSRASKSISIAFKNEYGVYYSSAKSFEIETAPEIPADDITYLNNNVVSQYQNHTLTDANSTPVASEGEWVHTNVPLEGNTTYSVDEGTTLVWFVDTSKADIRCIDVSTQGYQFTTPENLRYVNIANATTITKIAVTDASEDRRALDTGATAETGKTLSSSSYATTANDAYFVIKDIPVTGGEQYYCHGAVRVWFLTSSKTGISTVNAFSGTDKWCTFETPANAAYVSISFQTSLNEKELVFIRKLGDTTPDTPDEPVSTNYLNNGTPTRSENQTITADGTEIVASDGEWVYTNVPVEANTIYSVDEGTTIVRFRQSSTSVLGYADVRTQNYQFTPPDGTLYADIANATTLTRVGPTNASEEITALADDRTVMDNTNLQTNYTTITKDGYYTIKNVPLSAGKYYCHGAVRVVFRDSSKNALSTINAYTGVTPMFTFDAPSSTAYVDVASMYKFHDPELLTFIKLAN